MQQDKESIGNKDKIGKRFVDLVEIMERLRGPGGCPWDQEQTHESLKKYLIEEAYELIDAIEQDHDHEMIEELGDVLLQVVFHAELAHEAKRFTIYDAIDSIATKLVKRHPHVFGDREAHDAEEVLKNWESDKQKEKKERTSIVDGIANHLPALMEADQIQKKVRRVGFDWETVEEVFDKVEEEWHELRDAHENLSQAEIEEELGDLLFALVNIGRYLKVDPEEALRKTNRKFKRRFQYIEQELKKRDKTPDQSDIQEMDELWEEAKSIEREQAAKEV